MIKIRLDEAYVFDLLSILSIKVQKSDSSNIKQNEENYFILESDIIDEIGAGLFVDIIESKEFQSLREANLKVFELVNKANESEISRQTADANLERYHKKITLQHEFFSTKISEVKIQ